MVKLRAFKDYSEEERQEALDGIASWFGEWSCIEGARAIMGPAVALLLDNGVNPAVIIPILTELGLQAHVGPGTTVHIIKDGSLACRKAEPEENQQLEKHICVYENERSCFDEICPKCLEALDERHEEMDSNGHI